MTVSLPKVLPQRLSLLGIFQEDVAMAGHAEHDGGCVVVIRAFWSAFMRPNIAESLTLWALPDVAPAGKVLAAKLVSGRDGGCLSGDTVL
jgi:hypothetical protein